MRQSQVNLLPPATLAVILAFWAYAPQSWVEGPWAITAMGRADPPIWYGYFFTTIRNHSLHHTAKSYEDTRCNYGNSVIFWDSVFGTHRDGESALVGQDDRKPLSIWEQWTFPLRAWLEKRRSVEG